ncbi:MAG: IS21-like element helper ATPase IstB [Myxococcota bacterium]
MLTQPTLEKLNAMRLGAMAHAWEHQKLQTAFAELGFDERFGLLVDAEFEAREDRGLGRRMREAKLRIGNACIEDIQFEAKRGLDRGQIAQLQTCQWVGDHRNVIVTGATGVGKTYMACALAHQACRKGYRVIYARLPRLLDELAMSHGDGSFPRALAKLARVNVLVLDDWGLKPIENQQQRNDLLEVLEDRYNLRSTIVTSQIPISKWHDLLGEPSIADAILDRLVHNAYKLQLKGPSKRITGEAKKN